MSDRFVAVLGQRDEPADAVEEYCQYLAIALAARGTPLETSHVRWAKIGWRKALRELREKAEASQAAWFLVQYTALAWSRRGFPLGLPSVIHSLKKSGVRCAVVFHDPGPYPGDRLVDELRRTVQLWIIRKVARQADLVVLTIPVEKTYWIPKDLQNVVFIPVGANLPCPEDAWNQKKRRTDEIPVVAVFSMTAEAAGRKEVKRIAGAVRYASGKTGPLRLELLGRNSEAGGKQLQKELAGTEVEIVIHGLVSPPEVVRILGSCDLLLFVRGPVSTRRGSAIAGIACGLPVVACSGWETGPPITEAGVVLVPEDSENEFGPALVKVLQDDVYRASLRERSRRAQLQYFSWNAIAAKYASVLRKAG